MRNLISGCGAAALALACAAMPWATAQAQTPSVITPSPASADPGVAPASQAADDAFAQAVLLGHGHRIIAGQTYTTHGGVPLKLDLIVPAKAERPVPLVMLIHGGGWNSGTPGSIGLNALPYLQMGFAVANVSYRLTPQAPAPAALEDTLCALNWLGAEGKRFNIDTQRIVLTGNSAGGHLALMTGMVPAQSRFARPCARHGSDVTGAPSGPAPKVAGIINVYGVTDVADLLQGPNRRPFAVEWLGARTDSMALARELSPTSHARRGGPPVLTLHGDADKLVPHAHAVKLKQALDKAGQSTRMVTLKGAGHGGFSPEHQLQAYGAIRDFLRELGLARRD